MTSATSALSVAAPAKADDWRAHVGETSDASISADVVRSHEPGRGPRSEHPGGDSAARLERYSLPGVLVGLRRQGRIDGWRCRFLRTALNLPRYRCSRISVRALRRREHP